MSTYYTSSSRTIGTTSSMQDLFSSQAAFDDAVKRSVQSRLEIVRAELRSELRREYDEQVSIFQCELETLMRWAHTSGMRPLVPPHSSPSPPSHTAPSDAEGDLGPDHTTDLAD